MFNSVIGAQISLPSFLMCLGMAIVLGLAAALVFAHKDRHSATYTQALALQLATVTSGSVRNFTCSVSG